MGFILQVDRTNREINGPQNEDLPLGELSKYVRGNLRFDRKSLYSGDLTITDFVTQIDLFLTQIPFEKLLDKKNVLDRRIALYDLYLTYQVIRVCVGKDHFSYDEPQLEIEKVIKLFADVEGFSWKSMPWSLTSKDYYQQDLNTNRNLFVEPADRVSENLLLEMQHEIGVNLYSMVTNLHQMVIDIVRRKYIAIEDVDRVYEAIGRTKQSTNAMRYLVGRLSPGVFENLLAPYYPSGSYDASFYVVEAMLLGRTEGLMRKLKDLNNRENMVDPDIRFYVKYILDVNNLLPINFIGRDVLFDETIGQLASLVKIFRGSHLHTAIKNIEGGVSTLDSKPPLVGSNGNISMYASLRGN